MMVWVRAASRPGSGANPHRYDPAPASTTCLVTVVSQGEQLS
jgi:hypothetical protein